jgi:hypothetical protein
VALVSIPASILTIFRVNLVIAIGVVENLQSFVGFNTGDLWRWNKDTGLIPFDRTVPGTAGLYVLNYRFRAVRI